MAHVLGLFGWPRSGTRPARFDVVWRNPESHYALTVGAWQVSYYNRVAEEKRSAVLDEGLKAVLRARS